MARMVESGVQVQTQALIPQDALDNLKNYYNNAVDQLANTIDQLNTGSIPLKNALVAVGTVDSVISVLNEG